jgi:hypothetical protein
MSVVRSAWLIAALLGLLPAVHADDPSPQEKQALSCCGEDSVLYAEWVHPETGTIIGRKAPIALQYKILPDVNSPDPKASSHGTPINHLDTLYVSPCAVVSLYAAGGEDVDVCVKEVENPYLHYEVTPLTGWHQCVGGEQSGESAVNSIYTWAPHDMGEYDREVDARNITNIDFSQYPPGSYIFTFYSYEGNQCCNVGPEVELSRITIVSDPRTTCGLRGIATEKTLRDSRPCGDSLCETCEPTLAEWRKECDVPLFPIEIDSDENWIIVRPHPVDPSIDTTVFAQSHFFHFTRDGYSTGAGYCGQEDILLKFLDQVYVKKPDGSLTVIYNSGWRNGKEGQGLTGDDRWIPPPRPIQCVLPPCGVEFAAVQDDYLMTMKHLPQVSLGWLFNNNLADTQGSDTWVHRLEIRWVDQRVRVVIPPPAGSAPGTPADFKVIGGPFSSTVILTREILIESSGTSFVSGEYGELDVELSGALDHEYAPAY